MLPRPQSPTQLHQCQHICHIQLDCRNNEYVCRVFCMQRKDTIIDAFLFLCRDDLHPYNTSHSHTCALLATYTQYYNIILHFTSLKSIDQLCMLVDTACWPLALVPPVLLSPWLFNTIWIPRGAWLEDGGGRPRKPLLSVATSLCEPLYKLPAPDSDLIEESNTTTDKYQIKKKYITNHHNKYN